MTGTGRNGFALPATLLALVVIGALVTGGVYATSQHNRASANTEVGQFAFMAAERGIDSLFGTWIRTDFEANMPAIGSTVTLPAVPVTVDGVQGRYTLTVRRIANLLYMVESEGEILSAGRYTGSKRRVAQLMRLHYEKIPMDRAVTSQGPITMRGTSGISGQDFVPGGWTDCTDDGLRKSVVAKDVSQVSVLGASGLTGDTLQDNSLDLASFEKYGDMELDDLKQVADKYYPGSPTLSGIAPVATAAGECDTSAAMNWGAPKDASHPCHFYWPIIYADGNLKMSSGAAGQGILIVEGDLEVTGSFEFSGIVFVYGSLIAAGTGNKLYGSVNIYDSNASELGKAGGGGAGNTQIIRSTCSIERAYMYSRRFARPIPFGQRKFIDLSGIGVE